MAIRRFFSDQVGKSGTVRIVGDEFYHLKTVNRSRCGDEVEVVNGQGWLFTGEIGSLTSTEAVVRIKSESQIEKPSARVIVAPSLLKQRPMNIMVEKLAEIGVDEIRPVLFTRTDDTYASSRLKKWERIAVQALKVNRRLWSTEIFRPVSVAEIIEIARPIETRILLDITGRLPGYEPWHAPVIAVIGPPGDITDEERQQLVNGGFAPYRINHCVLKSETAAISIAGILKFFSGIKRV